MSDYNFWQNIEGGWKQLKNWCLHKRSDTPSDSIEGGVWYNETSKRIGIDVGSENKELAYVGEGGADYIGVIDAVPPILTYNNNGTITVASCNVRLYSNPDYNGLAKEYNIPSKTLTMTDGGDEIVIAHYNSGTPEYRLVNRVDINNYGNGDTRKIVLGERYDEVQNIINNEFSVVYHVVEEGENLSTIAAKYGTDYLTIAQMNGIVNPNIIYPGQKLRVK